MQRTLTPRQLTPAGAGGGEQRTQLATPVSQAESDGGDMQKQLERQAGHAKAWRVSAFELQPVFLLPFPGLTGSPQTCQCLSLIIKYCRWSLRPSPAAAACPPASCRARHRRSEPPSSFTHTVQDKAHRLGDLIIKQEAQNKALQHQLAALQHAQAQALAAATDEHGADSVLGAADLASMRQQLVLARAQLEQQAEELEGARADYGTRQALLKEAAGAAQWWGEMLVLALGELHFGECLLLLPAQPIMYPTLTCAGVARREVLSLQGVNRELQAVADRLQQQNDALAAQLRATQTASSELGSTGGDGWGSAGPSPAKRHNDTALLQAMLRKQDGCA